MIRFAGCKLRFVPFQGMMGCGAWRYHAEGPITVTCDAPDCGATIEATGLEHNGAEVEAVYLGADGGREGWRLGEQDLCPKHASEEES